MTTDQLRRLITARPFQPFTVHMADGRQVRVSHPETIAYVSRIVGAGEFEQRSQTAGERGRRSTTEGNHYRDLASPSVLREADRGTGVLVYEHLPPARIGFRPWFRDPELRALRDAMPADRKLREAR